MSFEYSQQDQRNIIRALAGAVSGKRPSTVTCLLRSAGVDTNDPPTRFTDAIRLIFPEVFSTVPDECPRIFPRSRRELAEVSNSGDLVEVIKRF